MVPGAYREARWIRSEPRHVLSTSLIERLLQPVFRGCRVLDAQFLPGGLRNANLKVHLDSVGEPLVLRIFEHDPVLCQKEVNLYALMAGLVPVPELIYAQTDPAFTLTRYVEGISFLELKRSGDVEAIAQAAYAAGEALAAIGRTNFATPGWITAGPSVREPLLTGDNAIPRFIESCLTARILESRMPGELRDRTRTATWSFARRLADLQSEAALVHGDFNRRNLMVRRVGDRWGVAAVLDWEYAVSGSSLADIASFLRYENAARPLVEPHFSAGYLDGGGRLPDDWRRLARVLDLAAIIESLTRDRLPAHVIAELLALVQTIV